MVCDCSQQFSRSLLQTVLILILLEYGLRRGARRCTCIGKLVLILILLEYGLRLSWCELTDENGNVLILILLEYGLRLNRTWVKPIY